MARLIDILKTLTHTTQQDYPTLSS